VPPAALALVLGAALCHSVWNLILKSERGRLDVAFTALVVVVVLFAPVVVIYPVTDLPAAAWALVALSGVLETGYFLALSAAYGAGELSVVYPVARGTAPLVVTPVAVLFLGERLSIGGLAGIALVVAGIFGSHAAALGPRSSGHRRPLGWAVVTGLMTSGYSLVNKLGVELVPVPLYAFLVFVVNTPLISVALWRRGQLPRLWSRDVRWVPAITVGVLMMTSYLAVLAAMARAPVSYVVAAREVSIVLAAGLGALVLHERHPAARIVAAAVIFSGLVLMVLGR
jgi:drug/metabolite transporter (DMT)-like permease